MSLVRSPAGSVSACAGARKVNSVVPASTARTRLTAFRVVAKAEPKDANPMVMTAAAAAAAALLASSPFAGSALAESVRPIDNGNTNVMSSKYDRGTPNPDLNLNRASGADFNDPKNVVGKGDRGIPGYDDLAVDPMKVGGKGDALLPKINLPNPGELAKKVQNATPDLSADNPLEKAGDAIKDATSGNPLKGALDQASEKSGGLGGQVTGKGSSGGGGGGIGGFDLGGAAKDAKDKVDKNTPNLGGGGGGLKLPNLGGGGGLPGSDVNTPASGKPI